MDPQLRGLHKSALLSCCFVIFSPACGQRRGQFTLNCLHETKFTRRAGPVEANAEEPHGRYSSAKANLNLAQYPCDAHQLVI